MKRYFLLTPLCLLGWLLFFSGIIRDDVDKTKYMALAKESQFDCIGKLSRGKKFVGSCVLVTNKYLLTSAHNFVDNNQVADITEYSFEFAGKVYKAKRVIVYPAYIDPETRKNCDIAMAELTESVTDIEPAHPGTTRDELNSDITGVGFGVSGTASKPAELKSAQEKIAGENVIDSLGGFKLNGIPTLMYSDFDSPSTPGCNKLGSAVAKSLEYIVSGGDSGGGIFRKKNNKWELVGICSGVSLDVSQFQQTGYYGQLMYNTRVSAFADWIDSTLKSK
jgi:secreted trypsin-like serine protease